MADGKRSITLHELNSRVRDALESSFLTPLWIQTEISEVRERGGHCYLEFIEKDPKGNDIIARSSAVIWKSTWTLLKPYFEQATSQSLSAGMQVLVQVEVTFHELYGYKLNVLEIDPSYTLGDIARKRQEILRTLEQEGVIAMNKELPMPVLIRNIAVISSPSAAGWGDFSNQLTDNSFGFAFNVRLFPATMQGPGVEPSVISALDLIADGDENWDVVVIIRGGGAVADLAGFDSLALAEHVAQFPLPVITGIGHERDDTIIDLIAHTRVKTPTAAAEMIINHQLIQLQLLTDLSDRLYNGVRNRITLSANKIAQLQLKATLMSRQFLESKSHQLDLFVSKLPLCRQILSNKTHQLELLQLKLDAADPERLLRLGYAIVRHEGQAVKTASEIHSGDSLQITLYSGSLTAEVLEITSDVGC